MRRIIPVWIAAAAVVAVLLVTGGPGRAEEAPPAESAPSANAAPGFVGEDRPKADRVRVQAVEVRKGYRLTLGPWSVRFSASRDLDLYDLADRLRGLVGVGLILAIAVYLSEDRRAISRRVVFWGLSLQWIFAILVLRAPMGVRVLREAGRLVESVLECALDGSRFVFGARLVDAEGPAGFVFAFRVLPTVVFVAALFAILYHLGVMQWVVRVVAVPMSWLMGTSGAESLDVAASMFLGQTEAPLTIRPYLSKLTNSELMTVMTAGMAHVSGGVMAAYFAYHVEPRHVLTAVVMTAPGSILLAKILVPETGEPETLGGGRIPVEREDANLLDAAARGTRDGLNLALNIGAVLIAFVGLVALVNLGLNPTGWRLEDLFGWALAPVAYLLGVPWEDCRSIGGLLGTRVVLNELVAFEQLAAMRRELMDRSFVIASFALCGFANIGSIGIQIGGIGALAPERRKDLARLGARALLAGTLANYLSACIAGVLL
ncbi:NupC/NupG family nucleoside CNT transporter [Planctomyces sp. SH-PL62]|uniref:NupC/NupG family nucleoside CNT transporter n=1 Tax=Planctomyces sp. SH-PL62 TaxID=1636152 RepID=UPI00078D0F19|nr:nucleoside transporter C-terminal domain-containing protein [Planctomyces sp. SH-PL62]AMV39638.1 Nucleoside permease NupX [Planctomyces sp. SH-PL62]